MWFFERFCAVFVAGLSYEGYNVTTYCVNTAADKQILLIWQRLQPAIKMG